MKADDREVSIDLKKYGSHILRHGGEHHLYYHEDQKRFENVIDTQHLLKEHHRQFLRGDFFRNQHYKKEPKE